MIKLMADFETTTQEDDVRVWASCLVDIDTLKVVDLSNNIDGFFAYVKNKNTRVWFHNLKFDGEFIIYHLMAKMGFKHNDSKEPGTFQTLITDTGQFYQITIYFDKFNKRYHKCVIQDSLKKLPFKVSVIAKTFNLPVSKGEIDYKVYRAPGHELTVEEREYIINDCLIVASALKHQFDEGLDKMTIGSDALGGYKDIFGLKRFERFFPVLPLEVDNDIRRAYRGGFTYLNPVFVSKRLKGIVFDVNSLYSSVMYNCPMPWGFPIPFDGEYKYDEMYPLYIIKLRCQFELKPGHIPTLQLKKNRAYIETEYLTTSGDDIPEFTLTCVDLALFLEHYDTYNLEYLCGYKFKKCEGIFKNYIDHWSHIKETSEGGARQLAKLMLNNLYGKFATNPLSVTKHPELINGEIKYILDELDMREPVYTPVGVFITSWARDKTIRAAQAHYDIFIYADTDSLHLNTWDEPKDLDIHPSRLGAWKMEGRFEDSKFLRAKTYMECYDGKWDVKCAGMPENVKEAVTVDNFTVGASYGGKLVPKRFPGGIVLRDTDFTIKGH